MTGDINSTAPQDPINAAKVPDSDLLNQILVVGSDPEQLTEEISDLADTVVEPIEDDGSTADPVDKAK